MTELAVLSVLNDCVTDQPTNQPTNQLTDMTPCRSARTHLKMDKTKVKYTDERQKYKKTDITMVRKKRIRLVG